MKEDGVFESFIHKINKIVRRTRFPIVHHEVGKGVQPSAEENLRRGWRWSKSKFFCSRRRYIYRHIKRHLQWNQTRIYYGYDTSLYFCFSAHLNPRDLYLSLDLLVSSKTFLPSENLKKSHENGTFMQPKLYFQFLFASFRRTSTLFSLCLSVLT